MALRTLLPLLLFLPASPSAVTAQAPVPLGAADRVVAEPFSQISGARELADGRLLISDRLEDRVVMIDAAGRVTRVGGPGSGPAEYRRPGRLMPMLADSMMLVDEGNDRLLVLSPRLQITRTLRLDASGVPVGLSPRAVDTRGRFYAQVPHWAAGAFGDHGDSVPVVRVTPGSSRPEILTWVLGIADPPGQVRYGMPFVPFTPADGWAFAPDGSLVIARVGDFHVERLRDGRVTKGAPNTFTPLQVTDADKIEFTRDFMATSGMGGRGSNGNGSAIGAVPADMQTDAAIRHLVETNLYATTKPPFTDRPPLLAPNGELWVERSMPLRSAQTFYLFDAAGRLTRQVALPAGRELLFLGASGVYAVNEDQDGVQHLERYPYPR